MILKYNRLVVPKSLKSDYTSQLHKGHLKADACKRRAKEALYWCTMNRDIETFINKCVTCISHTSHQQKEPMQLNPIPSRAWQSVGSDLFEWDANIYLVLVDSFSGWFEVDRLYTTTSMAVINKLKLTSLDLEFRRNLGVTTVHSTLHIIFKHLHEHGVSVIKPVVLNFHKATD